MFEGGDQQFGVASAPPRHGVASPRFRGRRRPSSRAVPAALTLAGLALATTALVVPHTARRDTAQFRRPEPPEPSAARGLGAAADELRALRSAVDGGELVPDFGVKAKSVLDAANVKGPAVAEAFEAALRGLFAQQLSVARSQTLAAFRGVRGKPVEVLEQADEALLAAVTPLVPAGSSWSFEEERSALRSELERELRRAADVERERRNFAQSQRTTALVVNRFAQQADVLADQLSSAGAGGPAVFWASFRVPHTPIQISGKYREGRTHLKVGLAPSMDPVTAEAGFVEGLTRSNLGLSLDVAA